MKNHILQISLFLFISIVLVGSWFKPGAVIGGAEETIPFLYPTRSEYLYKYSWEDIYTGNPQTVTIARYPQFKFLAFINNLGTDSGLLQILIFWVMIFSSLVAFYIMTISLFGEKKWLAFTAAIFYTLNPFSYSSIWHRYLIAMIFFLPLLPLSLLTYQKFHNNKIFLLFFLSASFIFSSAFSLPSNVITLWCVLALFCFAQIVVNWRDKKAVVKYAFTFCLFAFLWVLTNLWWLVPSVLNSLAVYSKSFEVSDNLSILRSITQQFPWWMSMTLSYKDLFTRWHFFLSVIMVAVSVYGLLNIKSLVNKVFIFFLFGISLFVVNGSGFPTGKLFEYLFNTFSPLQLFRNPYEKFGIVLSLVYSVGFAAGISKLFEKLKFATKFICIIFISYYLIIPWVGQVFGDKGVNFYTYPPAGYSEVDKITRTDSGKYRMLHVPLLPGDGLSYNWPKSYYGFQPSMHLYDIASIDRVTRIEFIDDYYKSLRKGYYIGRLPELAKYSAIGYVAVHKDIVPNYSHTDTFAQVEPYLTTKESPVKDFPVCSTGKWKILTSNDSSISSFCEVDAKDRNWTDYKFLKLDFTVDRGGILKVDFQSDGAGHLVFGGMSDKSYTILPGEVGDRSYLIDLRVPTEKYSNFNIENIHTITVSYYASNLTDFKISSLYKLSSNTQKQNFTSKVYTSEYLDLYKLNDSYLKPIIYASKSLKAFDSWYQITNSNDELPESFYFNHDMSKHVDYTYISNTIPKLSFNKIDPTFYEIEVFEAKNPFWLIFSSTYNDGWIVENEDGEYNHFEVNGFTNGYFISKTGTYKLRLRYAFEETFKKYKKISVYSFIIISIFCLPFIFKRNSRIN